MSFKSKNLILKKLIVLIMGVLILSMPVFAASNKTVGVTLKYEKVSIDAGKSFKLTIGLDQFNGVVGGIQASKFAVYYDSTNFTCKVFTGNGDVVDGGNELNPTKKDYKLIIVYLSSQSSRSVKTDGALIDITLTANANAKSGTYEFHVTNGDMTFVDCDTDTQSRDVKPIMPDNVLQKIKVGNSNDEIFTVASIPTSPSPNPIPNPSSNSNGSSIANNPTLVEQIKQQIDKLPAKITEKDKAAVDKINNDIKNLSPSDKNKITNNEKLNQANAEIDKLTEQGNPSNIVMIFIFIGLGLVLLVATFLIVKVIRGSKST